MKKSIVAVCVFLIAQLLASGVMFISWECSTAYKMIASMAASEVLTFAVLWLIGYFRPSDLIKKVPSKVVLICIPLIVCAITAMDLINSIMDLPNLMEEEFKEIAGTLCGFLSIALVGPVIEEIVFRKIMIDGITEHGGKQWIAILISSAVFGLIHLNPAQIPFAFAIGILFGWMYVRTGSMMPGLIGHILNNTLAGFLMRTDYDSAPFLEKGTDLISNPACMAILATCIIASVLLISALSNFYAEKTRA